ncbi:MAG: hypothetical protein ABIL62_10555 [Planctomycetota bacterium]
MYKSTILIVALSLCILLATRIQAQPKTDSGVEKKAETPTIDVTELNISDKILKLRYEIKNDSEHDIWICEDISVDLHECDFEAYMAEDKQTLLIRRRLDIEARDSVVAPPHGRYVRLRAGQSRTECLFLPLPVESRFFWAYPTKPGKAYAKSFALEIGYYPGDLSGMIRGILEKEEKPRDKKPVVYPTYPASIQEWFGGRLLGFYWLNWLKGLVRHRGEDLVIPWTGQFRMGEQVLRITIEDLRIPYEEKYDQPKASPPDLNHCTRIEMRYQPSILDYFFPYPNERDVLSAEEVKYLQSLQKIVTDNQEHIKAFAHEVGKGLPGGIFTERSTTRVICYRDGERLTSFTIYDDRSIVTEEEQCIRYKTGIPSLRMITTQIQPFQLRLDCADNLRSLCSLLQFLFRSGKTYPLSKWCDTIVRYCRFDYISKGYGMRYFKCPTAGPGKCHYAMNRNCKPNSPPDTVLLFETKGGWNQHGGPELFTFDNHDPRGGCVLLNDGTVKFIRTMEEYQKLRWK